MHLKPTLSSLEGLAEVAFSRGCSGRCINRVIFWQSAFSGRTLISLTRRNAASFVSSIPARKLNDAGVTLDRADALISKDVRNYTTESTQMIGVER